MNDRLQPSPAPAAATRPAPVRDLRDWLERVDAMGELVRVQRPVSRDEEMSAIGYLLAKQDPSPAVLFECASGFEKSPIGARLLWNIIGPSEQDSAVVYHETGSFEPHRAKAAP